MASIRRTLVQIVLALAPAVIALASSPAAVADPPGCLPLNGAQMSANSFDNTNYFGITYAVNVDYWYADGAVNWRKTVDGGSLNVVHTDTTGAVPTVPGGTVSIPGATRGRGNDAPITVTVCTR